MVIYYLQSFQFVKSPEWWLDTGANVHVYADISLFSFYQAGVTGSLLMGNGSHARVLGVVTVNLKLTSGKTVLLNVTPGFKGKSECKNTCASGSSYTHASTQ
jgi:hypothetical protein